MNTFIGACAEFDSGDVDEEIIAASDILYVEGYLWDQPAAKEAIQLAMQVAQKNNTKVALSLSDVFCVERHRAEFNQLIDNSVDILFANEQEAMSLTQTDSLQAAAEKLASRLDIAALTQSAAGVTIATDGGLLHVEAEKVDNVVDTTGAGDLFAAGFLYGLSQNKNVKEAAMIGNRMAGKIIQQMGARAHFSVDELAA
jgi:sugar/nucleoside kinase (ribokinase family)